MFASHTKHTQRKINGSTSFAIDNRHYESFRIKEQESVPWCGEIQNRMKKYSGTLSIYTPIPLDAQDVWSLNQFYVSRENMKECLSSLCHKLTHTELYI